MNNELISVMCSHLSKISKSEIAQLNETDRKLFTAICFACSEKIDDHATWNMIRITLYDWLKSEISELAMFANAWYPIVASGNSTYHTTITQSIVQFKTKNNLIVVVNKNNNGFISKFISKDIVTTVFVSNFYNDNLLISRLYQINDANAYDTCKEICSALENARLMKGVNIG
jgi:hypothetical protein